jgi:hypothetical protein
VLAVVLAEDDPFFRFVSHRLRLHRFTVVRYRDPVKLSDNLPELKPDLLVVRQEDFPLHWELLAAQLFCTRGMADCPFCLFAPKNPGLPAQARPWPKLSLLEESGSSRSPQIFSAYLSKLASTKSGSSDKAGESGSRLVAAAARREKATGS